MDDDGPENTQQWTSESGDVSKGFGSRSAEGDTNRWLASVDDEQNDKRLIGLDRNISTITNISNNVKHYSLMHMERTMATAAAYPIKTTLSEYPSPPFVEV